MGRAIVNFIDISFLAHSVTRLLSALSFRLCVSFLWSSSLFWFLFAWCCSGPLDVLLLLWSSCTSLDIVRLPDTTHASETSTCASVLPKHQSYASKRVSAILPPDNGRKASMYRMLSVSKSEDLEQVSLPLFRFLSTAFGSILLWLTVSASFFTSQHSLALLVVCSCVYISRFQLSFDLS